MSILFSSTAVIFVLLFHLGYTPLSPHCLIICMSLYVLVMLAMSPLLISNRLMKRRFSSVLQCTVPCTPELGTTGVHPVCVSCSLLLWLSHIYLHSSSMVFFICYGQDLVSVLLASQSGAALGLS